MSYYSPFGIASMPPYKSTLHSIYRHLGPDAPAGYGKTLVSLYLIHWRASHIPNGE